MPCPLYDRWGAPAYGRQRLQRVLSIGRGEVASRGDTASGEACPLASSRTWQGYRGGIMSWRRKDGQQVDKARLMRGLCRKVTFSRPNPKNGSQKINDLRD